MLPIKTIHIYLIFIGLLCKNVIQAQSTYQFGALPSVNITSKFNKGWSVQSKIESRQLIKSGDFNGTTFAETKYLLTDVSVIVGKK